LIGRGARLTATHGVCVLCAVVVLLSGCDSGEHGRATSASSSRSAPATDGTPAGPSPGAGTSTGATPMPAPGTTAPGQRLVVRSAGDRTSEKLDEPPSPAGYVVIAACVGRPGSTVAWVVTHDIGPVGDPATGTVPCDGDAHAEPALPASTVGVRVRLRLAVDLSSVESASAEMRAAG
jgi:hypothetical protein